MIRKKAEDVGTVTAANERFLPTASLMAPNPKHPPGPPMTLGNMCELGYIG